MCDAGIPKVNLTELHFNSSRCTEHRHRCFTALGRWCIQDSLKLGNILLVKEEVAVLWLQFELQCWTFALYLWCVPCVSASDYDTVTLLRPKLLVPSCHEWIISAQRELKEYVGPESYIPFSRDLFLCPVRCVSRLNSWLNNVLGAALGTNCVMNCIQTWKKTKNFYMHK